MAGSTDPRLSRHVNDLYPQDDLGGLIEAAEAVRAMLGSAGWLVLMALLDAEVAKLDAELDTDRLLETRADYAVRLGRRGGLKAAPLVLQALLDRAESRSIREHERDAESSQNGGT